MPDAKKKDWLYVIIQFTLIFLLLGLCFWDSANIGDKNSANSIIGLTIALVGFVFMAVSFTSFKQVMTPNPIPLESSNLTTTGVYKYIRHPMYSSVLLSLFGVVLYFKSISGFLIWIFTAVFIIYKIWFEEEQLIIKFPKYREYQSRKKN